ncbi:MAG: hypothetical protein OK454_09175, partial [Thaumarchaeota archaeon]|nr:hypothetical protein [Nitrososphaerota archaeon]
RESAMGLLIVPLLVQMLGSLEGSSAFDDPATVSAETATNWAIMEHAPTVLARLITDSEFLQKAAFECNAAKVFSKLLKDACEPLPPTSTSRQPWSPTPQAEKKNPDREIGLPTCRLGPRGQSPLHAHRIRMRESSLKAVTALMAFKDDYRKALVEQDIVPYIVESLSRTPSRPKSGQERERPQPSSEGESLEPEGDSEYGTNPVSVIISACHAVRMLSRSISILRTSLEDHGAAMPLFRLMRHPDLEVQIVATGAICNLVTEVAPMREVNLAPPPPPSMFLCGKYC